METVSVVKKTNNTGEHCREMLFLLGGGIPEDLVWKSHWAQAVRKVGALQSEGEGKAFLEEAQRLGHVGACVGK